MARPKTVDARDSKTRRETPRSQDGQSGAKNVVRHQEPETADQGQPGPDAAQDAPNVVETTQAEAETAEDALRAEVEAGAEGAEAAAMVPEAGQAGAATEPGPAQTAQSGGETTTAQEALASAASMNTDTALALKRWREHPTCCCGCGGALANANKRFLVGHDSRAHSVAYKIARGQMRPEDAPAELILRRKEISFLVRNPQFRQVLEAWDALCSKSGGASE
jgi:hypothetical protein